MIKKMLLVGAMVLAAALFNTVPADAGVCTGTPAAPCKLGTMKPVVYYTPLSSNQCCNQPRAELKTCPQCKPTIIRQNPVMGSCVSGKCEIVKPASSCGACCGQSC